MPSPAVHCHLLLNWRASMDTGCTHYMFGLHLIHSHRFPFRDMNARPAAIFITGRNPRRHFDDSHSGYTRMHALAASEAGYDTHMICLERESGSAQEPYELHAVSNDRRTPRQMYIPFSSPRLANAVTRLVQALGCPPT